MNGLKKRIQRALKAESGVNISLVEVRQLAAMLKIDFPVQRSRKTATPKPASVSKGEPVEVHIRWMIRADMADVLQIGNSSFADPWTEEEFIRVLRQRNCIGMVATIGDTIAGFMIYELHKQYLRVLGFAVHADFRCKTVGRQMVAKLSGKLSAGRREWIDMEISEPNLDGQRFLARMGFSVVEIEKGFWRNGGDAYRFRLRHDGKRSRMKKKVAKDVAEPTPWVDADGEDGLEFV